MNWHRWFLPISNCNQTQTPCPECQPLGPHSHQPAQISPGCLPHYFRVHMCMQGCTSTYIHISVNFFMSPKFVNITLIFHWFHVWVLSPFAFGTNWTSGLWVMGSLWCLCGFFFKAVAHHRVYSSNCVLNLVCTWVRDLQSKYVAACIILRQQAKVPSSKYFCKCTLACYSGLLLAIPNLHKDPLPFDLLGNKSPFTSLMDTAQIFSKLWIILSAFLISRFHCGRMLEVITAAQPSA